MTKLYFFCGLMVIVLFGSCEKGDIEHENSFDQSYKVWLSFKASKGNSYRYIVTGATWAGSSWSTTITVAQGKVVRRDFRYETFNDTRMPDNGWESASIATLLKGFGFTTDEFREQEGHTFLETLQWTEEEIDLGLHERSPASPVQTLDEIYETARTVWLKKRPDTTTYFDVKNQGMISSAGFVPHGCMDDCFRGIHIRSIEAVD